MTRGTTYIIGKFLDDFAIQQTDEFNGDMYRSGHGQDMFDTLKEVTTDTFFKTMHKWNKDNHNYSGFKVHFYEIDSDTNPWIKKDKSNNITLNFKDKYYEFWFSDYIYVKNDTDKNINVILNNGTGYVMVAGDTVVFDFGDLTEDNWNEPAEE